MELKKRKCFEFNKIKQFIIENRWTFMLAFIILCLIYGSELYNFNIRIDTERYIDYPNMYLNSAKLGRIGLVLSRILFEKNIMAYVCNPYYVTIGALIANVLSMILISYVYFYFGNVSSKISVVGYLIFIIHPVWIEQFYFILQVLPITIGILLTTSAAALTYEWIIKQKKRYILWAIGLLMWAIGTYQLFAILYIAESIMIFILLYRREYMKTDKVKDYIGIILKNILVFIVAYSLITIINKTFFIRGEYIDNMVKWGTLSNEQCLYNIVKHMIQVITVDSYFYMGYSVSLVLMTVTFVLDIKAVPRKDSWIYILAVMGLQICPFLLTIYQGAEPPLRAQYVLPFVTCSNFILVMLTVRENKIVKIISMTVISILLMNQSNIVMRLFYTDDIRFEEDTRVAMQLDYDLHKNVEDTSKPIAFIGTRKSKLNNACLRGELIGESLFNWDEGVQPYYYYYSSYRICDGLNALGYDYKMVSEEQILQARYIANNMSVWPAEGSIVDNGEFIVVKLSEDRWYMEDIAYEFEVMDNTNLQFNNELFNYNLESVQLEDTDILIRGWIYKQGCSSIGSDISIYLVSDTESIKLSTYNEKREDVNEAFGNEINYSNSGYRGKIRIDDMKQECKKYRIVLRYEKDGEEWFIDTEKYIQ